MQMLTAITLTWGTRKEEETETHSPAWHPLSCPPHAQSCGCRFQSPIHSNSCKGQQREMHIRTLRITPRPGSGLQKQEVWAGETQIPTFVRQPWPLTEINRLNRFMGKCEGRVQCKAEQIHPSTVPALSRRQSCLFCTALSTLAFRQLIGH